MKVVESHSPGYYFIVIRRNVSHGDYSDQYHQNLIEKYFAH